MLACFQFRGLVTTIVFLLGSAIQAQSIYCHSDGRFSQDPVFSEKDLTIQTNIQFASVKDWKNNTETLDLDAYFPALSVDPLPLRPVIVMIHGGGFISGDKNNLTRLCTELARRGFIALSINYRLGQDCTQDVLSAEKAIYRAQQDAMAAMRFVAQNASVIKADTSWIFIGGGSAGAATALNTVYMTQQEWNELSPQVVTGLGALNSSGNTLKNTYTIKGIFNNWGAVGKAQMQVQEMLPMIAFHGDADNTVRIDSAYGGSCTDALVTYGSRSIHQTLLKNNVCSDLTVQIGGDHGIYEDSTGTAFRAGRAACFFKSLFCENCSSFYQTGSEPAQCTAVTAASASATKHLVTVSPNPFVDEIQIHGLLHPETYTLLSIQGKVIHQGKAAPALAWSNLPPGVYLLKLMDGAVEHTFRLMKSQY